MAAEGRRCCCLFPSIVFPGDCVTCGQTHEDSFRLRIQAIQVPFRFYACGQISWKQHEVISTQIDLLVKGAFSRLKTGILGKRSVLYFFQECTWEEIKRLLQGHDLTLDREDELRFKNIV